MLLARCRELYGRLESAAVVGGGGGAGSSAQEVTASQEDKLKAKLEEAEVVLGQMEKQDKSALSQRRKQIRQEISSEKSKTVYTGGDSTGFEDIKSEALGKIMDLEADLSSINDQINCTGMKSLVDLLKRAVGEGWLRNAVGSDLQEAERELGRLNVEKSRLQKIYDPLDEARKKLVLDSKSIPTTIMNGVNKFFGGTDLEKKKNEIDEANKNAFKAWLPIGDVEKLISQQETILNNIKIKQRQHQTALRLLKQDVHSPVTKDFVDSITPGYTYR